MPQMVPVQMTPVHGHSRAFVVRRTTEGGGSEKRQKKQSYEQKIL